MKHEKYKELLELNVLGELTEEEQIDIENHLLECAECNKEYVQLKKMYSVITTERPTFPTDEDLINARKRLFNIISSEVAQTTFVKKPKFTWDSIFSYKYSFAFGSAALVLVGLFVGYLLFNNQNTSPKLIAENIIDLDKLESGEIKIAKVNFPEVFSESGEFEFKLGDKNPITYKGNLNDVVIQKLLATAIKETDNPGFKIKTANTVANLIPVDFVPDKKIKDAFIHSLKTDQNPGVRKGALKALINFPYDSNIRDALLFTLENDENASNRMDAINTLLRMNYESYTIDENLKSKLNEGITKEENEVVKYKTAKLLIGGK